jgi:hypothetical protein
VPDAIGEVLDSVFGLGAEDAAGILSSLGLDIATVGDVLTTIFDVAGDVLAGILALL